ncbi:MAG: hypothetical protein QME52_03815 [Bacteroidota bacterium]|nr:hypothetical protein [Bacteroidota bacterium]
MKIINGNFRYGLMFLILLFVISVMAPQMASSQCLKMRVSMMPFQQLSLADIDLEHFESKTLLFTLYIQNDTCISVNVQLDVSLRITLADGTQFPEPVTFNTLPFEVPLGGRVITNLMIGKNSEIRSREFNLPADIKEKVQNVALATGKFPAGRYEFDFKLSNEQYEVNVEPKPDPIEIKNPSRVELFSPRDGETTNEFPLFEFFHEGNKGVITIAEKLPDQSREDAIIKEPPMDEQPLTKDQNSFFYSGGRPLEQGKTYVWRVVSKILEVGGTENEISSSIGLFTVSSSTQGNLDPQKLPADPILKILEDHLGNQYSAIFEQIHKDGFKTSGQYILNGTLISRGELMKIINELRKLDNNIEVSFE